jgi:hypothetical protein
LVWRYLEYIVVAGVGGGCGLRARHADEIAKLGEEELIVGALRAPLARSPPGDECLDVHARPRCSLNAVGALAEVTPAGQSRSSFQRPFRASERFGEPGVLHHIVIDIG